MSLDLRPLTLGELLDRSFRLFRHHFWLFVGLMWLPSVLVLLLNVATVLLPKLVNGSISEDGPTPAVIGAAIGGGLLVFVLSIVYFVAYAVAIGATSIAVSEMYLGRQPTIATSYTHVRGHIGRLTLLMFLIGLRIFGIFVLCMIPVSFVGVVFGLIGGELGGPLAGMTVVLGMFAAMLVAFFFSLRYSIAAPALVLEPVTATGAIRRSVSLIQQNFWRTTILVLFAMVISFAAMFIFQVPFLVGAEMAGPESSVAFWFNLAGAVSAAIGGAVTGPVLIVSLAVLYYDLRIRKEGLDLQIMMARLDTPAPQPADAITAAG